MDGKVGWFELARPAFLNSDEFRMQTEELTACKNTLNFDVGFQIDNNNNNNNYNNNNNDDDNDNAT